MKRKERLERLKAAWARLGEKAPQSHGTRPLGLLPPRTAIQMADFLLNGLEDAYADVEAGNEAGTYVTFSKMRNVLVDFMAANDRGRSNR